MKGILPVLSKWLLNGASGIPTRVGRTHGWAAIATRVSVHPHACGADAQAFAGDQVVGGFIPTRVGRTLRKH